MILDQLKNLELYKLSHTDKIIKFISENDCLKLPNEQIEIEGKDLLVKVMEYIPKPASENRFETHQVYADLQYVVKGVELMQIAPNDVLSPLTEYDNVGDYQFFKADKMITELVVRQGEFTIFYPGRAHKPACQHENNTSIVKKLVFKIRMNKSV